MRVARLALVWVLFAVIGGLVFSGLDHALLTDSGEHTAVAEGSEHDDGSEQRDRGGLIVYDDDELQVRYGEYSETEFTLAFPRYRDTNENRVVVDWQVIGAQLPAGMDLQPLEERQALIYGTPQFVGRWCFTLAAQFELLPELGASGPPSELRRTDRQVCFFAARNARLSYPQFSTSTRLDRAEKNRDYSEKIRFEHMNRRTRVSVAWHNLPQSLKIETRNRRGYVKISGEPRDRDSHIIFGGNVSAENLPQLTKLFTAKDARRSHFDQVYRHTYRITAVYPDGETTAEFHKSLHVNRGEVVLATLTYDKRPFYFNVFRANGEHNDARFITRLEPRPSGSEYLLDSNAAAPRTIQATGNFYLMLKLTSADGNGGIVTTWKQFSLTIDEEKSEEGQGRRYSCPSGYYYDRILRHCVQNRGNTCPRGTYYEPEYNTCRSYSADRYCPTGYYFDHFLRRCVLNDYPRCPWNYRWYPFSNECVPDPYWCPLGFSYNWRWSICLLTDRNCARGWHYDYGIKRCVRNHRACSPGYVWNRNTQSCQRNRRNCRVGYHWSARLNRCVYHGNVRCRSGYRYDTRRRECVRIGRERRCPHGEHWSRRRGGCVDNNRPTRRPTTQPTRAPSRRPTARPSRAPSRRPTARPSRAPSRRPTARPSRAPSRRPTARPSRAPSRRPTARPSRAPSRRPTARPSRAPSRRPTARPSRAPSRRPTARPSRAPSRRPTARPSRAPSRRPTARPSRAPSRRPTARPSRAPSRRPTARPSRAPSRRPTARPSRSPSSRRRSVVTENVVVQPLPVRR